MTLQKESAGTSRLEQRKAHTSAAILAAAGTLFKEQGYESTSIQQIAERAETGVGTVYGYFPSKAAILHEVVRVSLEEAVHRYHAAIGAETPSLERICIAFRTLGGFVREYRAVLAAAVQSSDREAPLDDHMSAWLLDAYSGLISRGIERGELRNVPVEATVRTLVSAYSMAFLGLGIWATADASRLDGDLEGVVRALLTP